MHRSSIQRMAEFVDSHLAGREHDELRVLDIGSYDVNGTYRTLFEKPRWHYLGMDLEAGPNVDVIADSALRCKELRSCSFDVVISGQAFEHMEFPWMAMLEVERVLRPGGLCCLIVPSSGPEHRHPIDCWRFYPDGLVALAAWADLDVVSAETHWLEEGWGQEGDQWHDSVLVASKPQQAPSLAVRARRYACRWMMEAHAARRRRSVPVTASPD